MYGTLEWRECPYCKHRKYCSAQSMQDHVEDCPERPSQKNRYPHCPKCKAPLVKMGDGKWLCVSEGCDFEIGIITGGKLQE